MKISTKGRYALEAVVDLAYYSKNGLESLKNVSARLGISKNYLEQLFVVLRQKGIVDSVRGAQGGYRLAKESDQITAGDVVRALEGNLSPVACLEDERCNQPCEGLDTCVTRVLWHSMHAEINKAVDSVSIADLVAYYANAQKDEAIDYFI